MMGLFSEGKRCYRFVHHLTSDIIFDCLVQWRNEDVRCPGRNQNFAPRIASARDEIENLRPFMWGFYKKNSWRLRQMPLPSPRCYATVLVLVRVF
jgi:hypothetical protein